MASFVQQTEGVAPSGIGNQQIVQKDSSYLSTAARAVDSVFQGINTVGEAVGNQRAAEITGEALAEVERERRESEEFTYIASLGDTANAQQVARKAALLEKGVAQGKITRENARLRVTDLVTKGIEESPLFASQIRKSAERLLGFSLESEATRQFFGSFEPTGAGETTKSATEKRAEFLSQNTDLSLPAARQLIAQQDMLELQKTIRADKLAVGDMTADQALAERATEDDIEGTNAIFGEAVALKRQNKEINADTWAQLATKYENAFVMSTLEEYRAAGIPISSDQQAKVRANAKERYTRLTEQISKFDTGFLNKQNLERLVTAQKLFGAQAMPTFSLLVNSFGERIGSQVLDMYANAGGKPERLEAALGANPALVPFIEMLRQDPKKFTERMNDSLLKLSNSNVGDIDAVDAGFLDIFLNSVVKDAKPEDRESIVEKLSNKNLNTKAVSVLANAGRGGATKQEIKYMVDQWNLVQGVSPNLVAGAILEGNKTLTDRGARVELSADGKNLVLRQGINPITQQPQQATGHPAWSEVQKINNFLNASKKGWANDLGITDTAKAAKQFADQINGLVTKSPTVDFSAKFQSMSAEDKEKRRQELLKKRGNQ